MQIAQIISFLFFIATKRNVRRITVGAENATQIRRNKGSVSLEYITIQGRHYIADAMCCIRLW